MRVTVSLMALAVGAMLLTGCGKKQETAEQPASATEPASAPAETAAAPAAPAGPTADQVKALVATLPAPYNTGDVANGQAKFNQCRACHTPEQGGPNMTGPNLWGVFARPAASPASAIRTG